MACTNKKLRLVYGDGTLGIHGSTAEDKTFSYLFSYGAGGPESLVIDGKEWLYRVPRPTFWRALTDNDRGSRLHLKSGMWLSADMFMSCSIIRISVDGQKISMPTAPENNRYTGGETAGRVSLTFQYDTITVPATRVEVTYQVECEGQIEVQAHFYGKEGLPQLPVFGMRFLLPTKAVGYRYEGLSGETYPDRMAGGVPGVYQVEGLPVTPYLVPQDCNVHMDTKWVEIVRNTTKSNVNRGRSDEGNFALRFEAVDQNFAFSCIPYTAEELENATHQEELPLPRRTVVCILGAVRGVGGINSWGADVEPAYHIDASKDIRYGFRIVPA